MYSLSKSKKDAVIADCLIGELTRKEIAEKHGIGKTTFYRWLPAELNSKRKNSK